MKPVKVNKVIFSTALATVSLENVTVYLENYDANLDNLDPEDYSLDIPTSIRGSMLAAEVFLARLGDKVKQYKHKLSQDEREEILDIVWLQSGVRTTQMSDPDAVRALEKTVENYKGRKI